MAIHCSTLAWESTWTEKPGRLQSSELQSQTRLKRVSTQHTHTDVTYKSEVIRTWREHWRWGWGKSRSERWFPNEVLLFSRSVVSDSLPPKGLQQARLPCQSSSPGACSHSCPLSLLLPSTLPTIRVFSNESVLCIRWPKYWSFSFSISPCSDYSWLTSFMIDCI